MSLVVGLADKKGNVFMGSDSCAGLDYKITIRSDEKLFRRGNMLIGFTTSFRMGQLLRYKLTIPPHPKGMDTMEYLVALFVENVRTCLRDGGYLLEQEKRESSGVFLLCYRGNIYRIDSDFQVAHREDGFEAIGCGEDYALAVLHTVKQSAHPKLAIRKALECAAHFSSGVRPPFHILSLASG